MEPVRGFSKATLAMVGVCAGTLGLLLVLAFAGGIVRMKREADAAIVRRVDTGAMLVYEVMSPEAGYWGASLNTEVEPEWRSGGPSGPH